MTDQFCSRCEKSEKEVKLLDAIDGNEIIKICEECSLIENIPVIRKPSSFQLKTNEKSQTVYERLSQISGVETPEKKEQEKVRKIAEELAQGKITTKELSIKQKQELTKKINKPLNLVDNFHWHIQMARRKKKLSQQQLAEAIGETEEIITFIEKNELPDDAARIIRKIQQYLGLRLEKTEFEAEQARIQEAKKVSRVLEFDKSKLDNLTINDLIEMKKPAAFGDDPIGNILRHGRAHL